MNTVLEFFFLPPMAIARLGGSDTPLESFRWTSDTTLHGWGRTVIKPDVSFKVGDDGTVGAYVPDTLRFRDGKLLRPVAPFFELWARFQAVDRGEPKEVNQPLTLALLKSFGGSLASVRYRITMSNKKAQRRTRQPSCSFIATVEANGDEHERKQLLASSPHNPGEVPLVHPDRPISLGFFQVLRPEERVESDTDLSVLRVRYTPPRGEVYGPPEAIMATAKPLQEGRLLPPQVLYGRQHELVPEKNRILSPSTAWSNYVLDVPGQADPQPADTYDGAAIGHDKSWGVVDDTCDGILEADVVIGGQHFRASSRVLTCPPDFSPDRRPFISLADDLADRDLPPLDLDKQDPSGTASEIADLFQRVFETVSQFNLDLERLRGVKNSEDDRWLDLPKVGPKSMTKEDTPYVDKTPMLIHEAAPDGTSADVRNDPLPYTLAARHVHSGLTSISALVAFLFTHNERAKRLIRPPYGRVRQMKSRPGPTPNPDFRDPRVERDALGDMRMPPYLRDSDQTPQSLTWRQYDLLMKFINYISERKVSGVSGEDATSQMPHHPARGNQN